MEKWMTPWNSLYGLKVSKVCSHQPRLCAAIISTSHFVCVIACNGSFRSALCRWFTFQRVFESPGKQDSFCAKLTRFAYDFLQSSPTFVGRITRCFSQLSNSAHAPVREMKGPNCQFCFRQVQFDGLCVMCRVLCQIYINILCIYAYSFVWMWIMNSQPEGEREGEGELWGHATVLNSSVISLDFCFPLWQW